MDLMAHKKPAPKFRGELAAPIVKPFDLAPTLDERPLDLSGLARRDAYRQPGAPLIGHSVWRFRASQAFDGTMRERDRTARQTRARSHFAPLFRSVRRNAVATSLAAVHELA
jgi:hypothetical protein